MKKNGVKVICEYCGKEFYRWPSGIKRSARNFCSRECYGKANTTGSMITCDWCGKVFYRPIGRIKQENYCSVLCGAEGSRKKKSEAHKGKPLSLDHCQKISKANKGRPSPLRGRTLSREHRQKIGESQIGHKVSQETRDRISRANKGNQSRLGKLHTEESKRKNRESNKKNWENPEFAKKMLASRCMSPNKPEIALDNILQENFSGEYKFIGNTGKFNIERLIPDFININGRKTIIEMFGDYWHKNRGNIKYTSTEKGRKKIFNKHGYELLVIWEHELNNTKNIIKKVNEFHKAAIYEILQRYGKWKKQL